VADEIRKLADNTKENLNDMRVFVNNIHVAASGGMESMNNTIKSTSDMNSKLDIVSSTIKENVTMLKDTVKDVDKISESMNGIKEASKQINQAMDESTNDVERLNYMTQLIHDDAIESADHAKEISVIDQNLSDIVKDMLSSLNGGINAISNKDLLTSLTKAKQAHNNWMINLKKIVDEMTVYPIQTNSQRCAFGHFYHSITMMHPDVIELWKSIDQVHKDFHNIGAKVINAVDSKDFRQAQSLYLEAEKLSKEIFLRIDKVINVIENNSKAGVEILRHI
jgi:Methyl-accepting chemotaxis protein